MEEPISRNLVQIAKLYTGAFIKRVKNLDIDHYHYILLLIAEHQGQLTQKKLTDLTGKDKSSMVSIIDSLTALGYVYREINPDDRRQQLIKITEKASRDIPIIRESYQLLNIKAVEGITFESLKTFTEVLKQIEFNLNDTGQIPLR